MMLVVLETLGKTSFYSHACAKSGQNCSVYNKTLKRVCERELGWRRGVGRKAQVGLGGIEVGMEKKMEKKKRIKFHLGWWAGSAIPLALAGGTPTSFTLRL